MVQTVGVVVLALGLGDVFHSLEEGHVIDNRVVVAGYVVMRVAMIGQWLRLAAQSPEHRRTALTYVGFIALAQIGWVLTGVLHLDLAPLVALAAVLYVVELGGPWLAERGGGTPWHPHHIAERYGLLVIISLGEGVLGTIAAVGPVIDEQGWSQDAVVLVVAGVALTFGMWWAYFSAPFAELLARDRSSSFAFGYLHIVVFGAIAAVGAGLHVGAYVVEGEAEVGFDTAVRAVAIPLAVFFVAYLAVYSLMVRRLARLQVGLVLAAVAVLVVTVLLSSTGTPFALDVLLAAAAPWVIVVGFEVVGHRQVADHLDAASRRPG